MFRPEKAQVPKEVADVLQRLGNSPDLRHHRLKKLEVTKGSVESQKGTLYEWLGNVNNRGRCGHFAIDQAESSGLIFSGFR